MVILAAITAKCSGAQIPYSYPPVSVASGNLGVFFSARISSPFHVSYLYIVTLYKTVAHYVMHLHDAFSVKQMPYEFRYGVQDKYKGNDFGHEEQSNGNSVTGRYYVLLPDGRRQVVSYTADHQRGYIATITYENPGGSTHASGGNRYG